jgi:hypothetical protein
MSSRPALGSTQPSIQWIRALSLGLKGPGREAGHSPPTSAEVKKMWIYTSTPPYAFMAGLIPEEIIGFFILPNPSSRTMALESTQPLEMSTRNLPRGKGRPARKADNLTAICEPIF